MCCLSLCPQLCLGHEQLQHSLFGSGQVASCQRHHSCLQVRTLQSRLSDSNSLTARLQRDMLLVKAKAEALEYAVSEKDAEIDLLRQRQERQETQVESPEHCSALLRTACHTQPVHVSTKHTLFLLVYTGDCSLSFVGPCHVQCFMYLSFAVYRSGLHAQS